MPDYNNRLKKVIKVSILLYVLCLIWGLYFKFGNISMIKYNYNILNSMTLKERFMYDIIPFKYAFVDDFRSIDFWLNGIVFIPLGILLCAYDKEVKILKHVLICFTLSLTLEIVQLFTKIGGFATDDLIMNTLGYFLGLPIYIFLIKRIKLKWQYYICMIINFIMTVVLLIAAINMLVNINQIIDIFH